MSTKKRLTKKELEAGLASGQITYRNPKAKNRKGYEIRIVGSGTEELETYPGLTDHPSPSGTIEYAKHVDISELATVWEAIANEHYVQGGMPAWIRESLSDLDLLIYWQLVHYQMVWAGKANMSLKTLSRNVGRPYRSIQRSIHRLLNVGAIELIRKHTGRSPAAYRVVLLSSLEILRTVEMTDEDVETTKEIRIDDRGVVQKTKPLKGRVARYSADAGRATTREKKSNQLLTIDEARSIQAKALTKQDSNSKPKLFRSFFPVEVRKEKIVDAIGIEFLAKKWAAVLEMAKTSGDIDLENGTFIAALEADEEKLFELVALRLTQEKFDVRNLPKAIEVVLNRLFTQLKAWNGELVIKQRVFNNQRDRKRQQVQDMAEALRV